MLAFNKIVIFLLGFLFSAIVVEVKHAKAQSGIDCPATLATVNNGFLSIMIGKTIQEIYKKLNCRVTLHEVPGRRGIALFNIGQVNGEVMRLDKVEPHYSREFVRSKVKLLEVKSSLWGRPDMKSEEEMLVGYTFGVIWQENYVEGKRARKFNNNEELFAAYSSGEISNFLAAILRSLGLLKRAN
ncbi:hypothetical protein [Kiloniella sp.]|uniref:hypothetical protein n=1 Tax=Kiloniella sp. TaxID=1938587 RepID=UPI003B02C277